MNESDTKIHISQTLSHFAQGSLRENGIRLLNALGYRSERQVVLSPNTFEGLVEAHPSMAGIHKTKALVEDWRSVDILFQLTGEDLRDGAQGRLIFEDVRRVDNQIIESYLFLAIELKGSDYSRTKLADLTREVNRFFAMPVMILFKYDDRLTLSIINRRLNKRDENKDVLEKVTLIKDIHIATPLRAHIEILFDLSLDQLQKQHPSGNFVELHRAWQKVLDTSELNKKFYREIANWYFWAVQQVEFPSGAGKEKETRNATSVIRLITRLIFVWFIKEKGLVPESLFDYNQLKKILNFTDSHNSTYYKAILQNLFFATLNTEMGPERRFRGKAKNGGLDANFGVSTMYRFENYFQDPAKALQLFARIPFLNGGLFECLDKPEERQYVDGFSERAENQPVVPDRLFFGEDTFVDLNDIYGDTRHAHEKVHGLIHIFNNYKFTIEENTPLEEEIALDPELLGKVFENLLAAYNPETGTTARKQTGSFYTPREIVNYMVDEALIAYFETRLEGVPNLQERLRDLLAYNQRADQFTDEEDLRLIAAIDSVKVLDPACGSGAFPMGMLHKLVFILSKLDPRNRYWKEKQISKAVDIPDPVVREKVIADIEQAFNDNELNYGRKLYLIENCIYGVDVQPIAVQIAKLRFFISLVVDQKVNADKPNLGIRPLPNLETKFVAANSLIGIERPLQMMLRNPQIEVKEAQLAEVRNALFTARTPATKRKYRDLDKQLRLELADLLKHDGWGSATAAQLAGWDPYNQNASAGFFDPEWMFGISYGFDIVIGNPPYVQLQTMGPKADALMKLGYVVFARTGDLYCLFYEKGFQLLRPKGILAFITSNKWMRAGYGEALRGYFAKNTDPLVLVDFSGQRVFESATVDVNILISKKSSNQGQTKGCVVHESSGLDNLSAYIDQQSTVSPFVTPQSWTILSSIEQRIKKKIEEVGTPLRDWDIQINYGIKTGLNEAFIISGQKKDELIALDPKSAEIIRPILRGRDIKRYGYSFADLYLICTFPSRNYDIEQFPAIKKHLLSFGYERLEQSGNSYIINGESVVARKKTNNKWFETQDSIGYWEDFYKQKIVYNDINTRLSFALVEPGIFFNNTVYFIPENTHQKYLLASLNSKLLNWYYKTLSVQLGERAVRMFSIYVNQIPLLRIDQKDEEGFNSLVDSLLLNKKQKESIDREIDEEIYNLYNLTSAEIGFIENGDPGL